MANFQFKVPKYPTSTYYLSVREIFYKPEYLAPRDYRYQSRYSSIRRIVDKDTNNVYHESFDKCKFNENINDRYYTVNLINKNRLDMISNEIYGTPNNWWIIAMCNDIIDPFNIPMDTVLRIPPITSLYESGGLYSND